MRYIWHSIQQIIETYEGKLPLGHFLKNYFRNHPKLGSRDRKILSEMAYCWYRCSQGLNASLDFQEKIRICLLIGNSQQPYIKPFLPEEILSGADKTAYLAQKGIEFNLENLFPFNLDFSEG